MPQASEQSIWVRVLAQVADIIMTVVAFVSAFALRTQIRTAFFFGTAQSVEEYYNVLIMMVILWWLLLDVQKAYSETQRVSLWHECKIVGRTILIGLLILFGFTYLVRIEMPPRSVVGLFVVVNGILLCLNRIFFRYLREYLREEGALSKTILVVGSGEKAQRFLTQVRDHAEWEVNLIGFVDFDSSRVGTEMMGAKVLGTPPDLLKILHAHPIHEVVFAIPTRQLEECTDMLALCEQEGVNAIILSNFFSSLVAQVDAEILYDQPVLIYRTTRHKEWQLLIKRLFDIVFSATVLIMLSPLLAAIALLIKMQDGGPVFYSWKVVGQNKKKFTGYKFRTMVINADALKERLTAMNEMSGAVFKITNDPRITKIGRFLRKYSLDELPQFWSVLKGDMAIIGPRPPLDSELPRFESWQRRKLSVKPGLTCLWQISGRSTITDFDEWVRLDLAYIDNWSLWLDFKILMKTVPAVLSGRGAR
ncbi:sugar transferase [candidate division KSB1 bacterium]|nr:MAG: sugar transferase [candidate division KSB1 bacterium]